MVLQANYSYYKFVLILIIKFLIIKLRNSN